MYDTCRAYIGINEIPNPELIIEKLSGVEEVYSHKIESCRWRGYIKNLKVNISLRGMTISGSLCKFYHGNNLQTLSLEDTRNALSMLSEILGFDVGKMNLSILHLSTNLELEHPCKTYLSCIGQGPGKRRMSRINQKNGVELRNARLNYQFYDKLAEMKNKKEEIPVNYIGKNIMRFEVKFLKNLKGQLKRGTLNLEELAEREFYNQMVNKWEESFHEIRMKNTEQIPFDAITDSKGFQALLMSLGVDAIGGLEVVLEAIENAKLQGRFPHDKTAPRLKKKVHQIRQQTLELVPNPQIDELKEKIQIEAGKYLIS